MYIIIDYLSLKCLLETPCYYHSRRKRFLLSSCSILQPLFEVLAAERQTGRRGAQAVHNIPALPGAWAVGHATRCIISQHSNGGNSQANGRSVSEAM